MRIAFLCLLILAATPLFAQEEPAEESSEEPARDYSREALRDIFLEAEAPEVVDPFKSGLRLFEFRLFGTKTTLRFVPFGMPFGAGSRTLNPIPDPFALTGNPGSAISPRIRSRYTEWWTNRKLGFPISPPEE